MSLLVSVYCVPLWQDVFVQRACTHTHTHSHPFLVCFYGLWRFYDCVLLHNMGTHAVVNIGWRWSTMSQISLCLQEATYM